MPGVLEGDIVITLTGTEEGFETQRHGDHGAAIVGVVLSQAMHATGWREVLTIAGTICLAAACVGAFILLLELFLES